MELGVKKKKIVSIPNGIDIKKFSKFLNKDQKIEKKINLITVARFAQNKKGLDLIPKISKILYDRNINFEWSLIGHNLKKIQKSIL